MPDTQTPWWQDPATRARMVGSSAGFLYGGDRGAGDFFRRGYDQALSHGVYGGGDAAKLSNMLRDFGASVTAAQGPLGATGAWLGYSNLADILQSQGKTDPQAFNRMLGGISQGTNQQQGQLQAILAQRGLGGSGVGQALGAAVGQAGQSSLAGARANEAQLAEQRKRDDLDLLLKLIVQPSTDASAMYLGQYNQNQARSDQQSASKKAMYAQLATALASMFCWAAEAIFHNPQDEDAVRAFMVTEPDLAEAYLVAGKDLAFHVEHDEAVRRIVEPRFHEFADRGYELVG